ncbi:MAG: hypothetical protein ACRDLF_14410, partial [Solirubrobacteraceae bacterium]
VPTLDWTASTIVGSTIAGYEIFREVDGTPPFTLLTTVGGATLTYADNTADLSNHRYTYYVIAQPTVGLNSVPSNQVTVTMPKATTPVLSGSVIVGVPTLDWTASTIAGSTIAHYEVFREVDATPPFTLLTTVDGATLTYADGSADPTHHSYTYYVIAEPTVGVNSDHSNEISLGTTAVNVTVHVTSASNFEMPFGGTWETAGTGYSSDGDGFGTLIPVGAVDSTDIDGHFLAACCVITGGPPTVHGLMILLPAVTAQDVFESVDVTLAAGATHNFTSASAAYTQRDDNGDVNPGPWQCWFWNTTDVDFSDGEVTTVTFNGVA